MRKGWNNISTTNQTKDKSSNYNKSIEEVINQFNTDSKNGLSTNEAEKRLKNYGANELAKEAKVSPWSIFIDQFKNIIVLLLIVAAGIAFIIGDMVEGFAVLAVIILNALFGFFTEYKAERSVQALKKMVTTQAKVIREGSLTKIEASSVVPGDLLVVEEGDRITADGRLIEADNLAVEEATLTGESEAVSKDIDVLDKEEVPLAERANMVFMGTAVTRGNGVVVVTATGSETEMGRISGLLDETEEEVTPLEKRLDQMGKSLITLTLIIAAIVSVIGIISGRPIIEMLETGVALAIAAVPEGLPAVATITLAIGMKKMARHNALVKQLPAVETLGSTTVICTDKTGTLTENQMTLKQIYFQNETLRVTGTGYQPEGEFKSEKQVVKPQKHDNLSLFLQAATLCSNAIIERKNSTWEVIGDPTEGALVTGAKKAGFEREEMEKGKYERLEEIPFTSDAKYMAVSYQLPENESAVFIKGAPSVILDMCSQIRKNGQVKPLSREIMEDLQKKNQQMAEEGLRVLGIAYSQEKMAETEEDIKSVIDSGVIFLGFAGIMDPPRADVKEAINKSQNAGIKTIMITGDQPDTAQSIAKKVGIAGAEGEVITGSEINNLSLTDLTKKIKNNSIFARVSPENKLDIVDALNENDQITAMTGDGVNDAPALKKANIGVAMGERGTAVAREAADMVLLDDNFATIVRAVKQGRVIFDNIEKFIYYLFSCNLSEIIFIFLGIVLQIPVPLLALQILWLNLVTDVFPALVLAWEPPEMRIMDQSPRNPKKEILTSSFKRKIGFHGFLIALGPLGTYLYALNAGLPLEMSRTVGFMTLAFVQLFHVFNARREEGTGFDRTVMQNSYLWGAIGLTTFLQLMTIYLPFLRKILNTTLLSSKMWFIISIGAIVPIVIIQLIKIIWGNN